MRVPAELTPNGNLAAGPQASLAPLSHNQLKCELDLSAGYPAHICKIIRRAGDLVLTTLAVRRAASLREEYSCPAPRCGSERCGHTRRQYATGRRFAGQLTLLGRRVASFLQ